MTNSTNLTNLPNLIEGKNLVKDFELKGGLFQPRKKLRAIDQVNVTIAPGEVVGLVGESGSGKSTLGRLLLGLSQPSAGEILYEGRNLTTLSKAAYRQFRAEVQVVFQDTGTTLNPRRTIGSSLQVPLRYNRALPGKTARTQAAELLQQVGLEPAIYLNRYPHELSGGQRQRVGLARALASEPRLVIADEPVSALDVSVRAQILKLMLSLQTSRQLAYLLVTHDLGVVRAVASRLLVMYLGRIVEEGPVEQIFTAPAHPYTRFLLSAIPVADPTLAKEKVRPRLQGELPSPSNIPTGCRFHTRCPLAQAICREQEPPLHSFADGQRAACHFAEFVKTNQI